ncbi:phosphotransferase [Actinoplanes sp. NPDC051859]|uniref:phosphotransferase n=1 Tax=Actinoplanes sp. NPDC051859 TaxID=3363909 RepID=UPI0037A1E370
MLTPPDDLPTSVLHAAFGLDHLEYQPVGWGSHHWTAGDRWFLTVDDLEVKRQHAGEELDVPYARLRRTLDAVTALDLPFAVTPVRPLVRVTPRYAAALYPSISGQSFSWGAYPSEEHRDAVRTMLGSLHSAPQADLAADDFTIPHRDALTAEPAAAGPYSARVAALLADHAAPIQRLLARYDSLVSTVDRSGFVPTHGEPHPGNTMRTADGWKLIDWDTALLAPPERDLWLLGGDPADYTAATGIEVRPELLELYRSRWLIADVCVDADRFRRPHTGTAEDDEAWLLLQANVEQMRISAP